MDDYMDKITAAKLLDNLVGMVEDSQENDYDTAIKMGIEALKADVQPVRHGHWTLQEDRTKKLYGWHICSECGAWIGEPTNYCSNCGADMRGEQNDG